jgi:hypothetical protein
MTISSSTIARINSKSVKNIKENIEQRSNDARINKIPHKTTIDAIAAVANRPTSARKRITIKAKIMSERSS